VLTHRGKAVHIFLDRFFKHRDTHSAAQLNLRGCTAPAVRSQLFEGKTLREAIATLIARQRGDESLRDLGCMKEAWMFEAFLTRICSWARSAFSALAGS
jgi:hypothetical protein